MADLIFLPVADRVLDGTYTIYDGACGTGGMLTVGEQRLKEIAKRHGKQVSVHLFGQEVNPETYAITKADLILKGEGEEADNFTYGSTLSADGFPSREFDFMMSNPPYGKSWKNDLEKMGGKGDLNDPRLSATLKGETLSFVTRSSDGQLVFLVNKLTKMKESTPLGSRIAEVHNGSSLFTGDAGQGESNIRRWLIENDWLEAIIALPQNIFYNTGISTYIWVLTNRKPKQKQGKVQLINASAWFKPLRKNLGKKNCELGEEHIEKILDLFLSGAESEQAKLFPNEAFGYYKVIVDRPLRLAGADPNTAYSPKEIKDLKERLKRDENAPPLIKKIHKGKPADPLNGLFEAVVNGKKCVVEYEPDSDLRDTENIPLLEEGGIEAFIQREVWPHTPDAWILSDKVQIGYEISFTRYFYKPKPMRCLEKICRDIVALEKETEGLLAEILVEVAH